MIVVYDLSYLGVEMMIARYRALTPCCFCYSACLEGRVEMMIARYRALTLFLLYHASKDPKHVEMMIARYRALTLTASSLIVSMPVVR